MTQVSVAQRILFIPLFRPRDQEEGGRIVPKDLNIGFLKCKNQ